MNTPRILAGLTLCLVLWTSQAYAQQRERTVTLLVHGMKFDLQAAVEVWGSSPAPNEAAGSGLIGHLQQAGHRFGGILRMRGAEPETQNLDARATLFALEFSDGANVDGLAYKALELASAIKHLRLITGCRKVNLVAHSAGGLVARAYLQSALPGIAYNGDVDRLITISTPHLGSALAEHLGDFLGTRATALQPGGDLLRRINDELPLPDDVLLASIIVRGVGASMAALEFASSRYDRYLNHDLLRGLPIEFRRGGDQVVDVRSQNLRLTRTAARYEAATGKPVLYLLARVADPSPADRSLAERSVHEAGPGDPWTCLWIEMLLGSRRCWSPLEEPLRTRWLELQATMFAYGIIEEQAARSHPLSQVTAATVDRLRHMKHADEQHQYYFTGRGHSRPRLLSSHASDTQVTGLMQLKFDPFGRILTARHALARAEN